MGRKDAAGRSRPPGVLAMVLASLSVGGCSLDRRHLSTAAGGAEDLAISLAWGAEGGPRVELYWLPAGEEGWWLRVRSARSGWPPVFDATFETTIPEKRVRRLSAALEKSGFFALPAILHSDDFQWQDALLVRIRQYGRTHQVHASGRSLPALERTIQAIDRELPVRLPPLPDWLRGLRLESRGRPPLAADRGRALQFHQAWLAREPERTSLLVDLFALFLATGRWRDAAAALTGLEEDPDLAPLVPSLAHELELKEGRRSP